MNSPNVPSSCAPRVRILSHALFLACSTLSLQALAADECGATKTGEVVCKPGTYPQVRYEGVEDFDLVLDTGTVVDGSQLPERDTAVVVYGEGALTLTAREGTVIRNDGWPAIDIVSGSGPVTVDVDQVFGGGVGIAALANGNVTIRANHVEGDIAVDAQSLGGDIDVDVVEVVARNTGGVGVLASTEAGNTKVAAGDTRTFGDFTTGLFAESKSGNVFVDADYVSTEGIGTRGIIASSWENGDTHVQVNTVSTYGIGGVGILAAAGLGDVSIDAGWVGASGGEGAGIVALAFNGSVDLSVWGVSTDGDIARGIDIAALGHVNALLDNVTTLGNDSNAVNIETVGEVAVEAQRLTTYGTDSYAINVLTSGEAMLDIAEISTYGERGTALQVATNDGDIAVRVGNVHTYATTGDWYAIGLSSSEGHVALQVDEQVLAESGTAITVGALFGDGHVLVSEGATVYGATTAIDAETAEGMRIDIAGTVENGTTGPTINLRGNDFGLGAGDIRIASTGALNGHVALSGGDDVISNAGTMRTDGHNVFGAGDDRFANAGTVALRGDETTIGFAGLERFENAGRVVLDNGRTGDLFTVDGTLHGAGGTLGVDVDLTTGNADRIVAGNLSGVSAVSVDLMGRGSLLDLQGVQIVTSGSDQSGDEVVLAADSRTRGFVGFRLKYDGLDSWMLEADLADQAYLAGAVPAGVRDAWRLGVQSVSTHLTATHDGEDTDGVWFQLVGGDFEGTSHFSHARGSRDLDWDGDMEGAQLGAEISTGPWRAGITGGYGKATMDLGGSEETRLDSVNIGLYARYFNAGWFVDGVLRGDRVDVETEWQSIGLQDAGDGSTIGLSIEGGHRFELSRLWIEPMVRVSWIDVDLPDQVGQNGGVHWEGGSTGAAELGLRLGATDGWAGVRPYADMAIAREFGGGDVTDYDIGFESVRVVEDGDRSFGRFAAGAEWTIGQVDLYGEIEQRFGDMDGFGGRIGARVRF